MTFKTPMIVSASALMVLSACAGTGTYDNTPNRTQQGALVGAVAGGLIGASRDSSGVEGRQDAVRGALIGAAAGAIAGNILDRQAAELRQSVSSPDIQVINRGGYLQVIMPEGILFSTASATVSAAAQDDIYAVARNLNTYRDSLVQVIGHTDNVGSAAYNQDLSQRRSNSVRNILVDGGVKANRVIASGKGFEEPVASNATEAGRATNRRVEILIRPFQ